MKHLHEMKLMELDSNEQRTTEGGFAPLIVALALLALAGCDGCMGDKKPNGNDQLQEALKQQ